MAVIVSDSTIDQTVLTETLVDNLVCPIDHADLRLTGPTLVCTSCERVYPIDVGIPNMLVDAG